MCSIVDAAVVAHEQIEGVWFERFIASQPRWIPSTRCRVHIYRLFTISMGFMVLKLSKRPQLQKVVLVPAVRSICNLRRSEKTWKTLAFLASKSDSLVAGFFILRCINSQHRSMFDSRCFCLCLWASAMGSPRPSVGKTSSVATYFYIGWGNSGIEMATYWWFVIWYHSI